MWKDMSREQRQGVSADAQRIRLWAQLPKRARRSAPARPCAVARLPTTPPAPPSRTKWTRLVPPPVLSGHAASVCRHRGRAHRAPPSSPEGGRDSHPRCRARTRNKILICLIFKKRNVSFFDDNVRARQGAAPGAFKGSSPLRVLEKVLVDRRVPRHVDGQRAHLAAPRAPGLLGESRGGVERARTVLRGRGLLK
jgi:hypothetical protein